MKIILILIKRRLGTQILMVISSHMYSCCCRGDCPQLICRGYCPQFFLVLVMFLFFTPRIDLTHPAIVVSGPKQEESPLIR